MELKIGTEITAMTIFEQEMTGNVTAILEKSVVIENGSGRHVMKRDVLKKMGYLIHSPKPPDRKQIQLYNTYDGEQKRW